jgi:hypothetical protein
MHATHTCDEDMTASCACITGEGRRRHHRRRPRAPHRQRERGTRGGGGEGGREEELSAGRGVCPAAGPGRRLQPAGEARLMRTAASSAPRRPDQSSVPPKEGSSAATRLSWFRSAREAMRCVTPCSDDTVSHPPASARYLPLLGARVRSHARTRWQRAHPFPCCAYLRRVAVEEQHLLDHAARYGLRQRLPPVGTHRRVAPQVDCAHVSVAATAAAAGLRQRLRQLPHSIAVHAHPEPPHLAQDKSPPPPSERPPGGRTGLSHHTRCRLGSLAATARRVSATADRAREARSSSSTSVPAGACVRSGGRGGVADDDTACLPCGLERLIRCHDTSCSY